MQVLGTWYSMLDSSCVWAKRPRPHVTSPCPKDSVSSAGKLAPAVPFPNKRVSLHRAEMTAHSLNFGGLLNLHQVCNVGAGLEPPVGISAFLAYCLATERGPPMRRLSGRTCRLRCGQYSAIKSSTPGCACHAAQRDRSSPNFRGTAILKLWLHIQRTAAVRTGPWTKYFSSKQ